MGHWGVKSYENDDADSAIDSALEKVHGEAYEALMDDRNTLSFDEAQKQLANSKTLAAAIDSLREEYGSHRSFEDWAEDERLAFAGVVVRHAEFGVPLPAEWRDQAITWLDSEAIAWDEATVRKLRRQKEIALLSSLKSETSSSDDL